jgi:hemoglobin
LPYTADFSGGLPADQLILAIAATHDDIVTDPDGSTVLFNQLGGYPAVNAVVDDFIANVAADDQINWMFANTDITRLNDLLVEQICEATGGYCTYSGRSMLDAHAGMAVTDDQFGALVVDLLLAFDHLGVPYTPDFTGGLPADQLVLALATMYPDIVTDADGSTVLFNQLGGYAAVNAVVADFLGNVGADDRINWMFANADLARLEDLLVEQICEATGGYCVYSGLDMATAHAGMAITDTQFSNMVEDLLSSFDNLGVPYTPDFSGGLPADQLVLALASMQQDIVTDPTGSTVLFNQLGGHAAVQAVIDEFLVNVAADSRINARFATTDIARLNSLLVEQVCEATGGYCVYSGLDMLTAHTGMGITSEEFGYMVEDLLAAFDSLGVPYTSGTFNGGLPADSLVLALAAMETDIVGH